MPFLALLAACASDRYGILGGDDASNPSGSNSTEVTALVPSPSQWGTCATLRGLLVVGGPGVQFVGAVVPTYDGGRFLSASSSTPVTLGEGQPGEVTFEPLGEDVDAVARYDAAGMLLWAVPVDGSQAWLSPLVALPDGGVVGGGACDGTTQLAEGAVPTGCPRLGESDGWLVAFDADGSVAWTRWFGGPADDAARDLAPTADGGFVVSGVANGDMTFGAGETTETTLTATSAPGGYGYIARYAADGSFRWVRLYGGSEWISPNGVEVDDSDDITIVGTFGGEGLAVWGEGSVSAPSDPAGDEAFVAKYGGDGTFRWLSVAGGSDAEGQSVAPTSDGGAFAVGWFDGVLTLGRGEPGETSFVSDAYADMWVARFGPDGALQWAGMSSSGTGPGASGRGVASTDHDEVLVSGGFVDLVVLGSGTTAPVVLSAAQSSEDGFLALYAPDGTLSCAVQMTGSPSSAEEPGVFLEPATLRPDGGWDVRGSSRGVVAFGAGTAGEVEVSTDDYDAFVATIDLVPQSDDR